MEEFILFGLIFLAGIFFVCYKISYWLVKENITWASDLMKEWQKFAESKNLHFESGGNVTDTIIYGDFHGYSISIHNEIKSIENESKSITDKYTIFKLKRNKKFDYFTKQQTDGDTMRRFWTIYNNIPNSSIFGDNIFDSGSLEITSKKISFTSDCTKTLQPIINQMFELIEIFPEVCMIGGEAVTIIEGIADETAQRIKPNASLLLCKKCLTFCSSDKVKPSTSKLSVAAKYYGCRLCKQSRDFIEGRSIAVLHNQMNEKLSIQENEISVNWLTIRKPFDFHEVRIVQATDRDVEEFAMQAGNDMDEFRQPRYKEIPCIIASGCKLSANTRNILKHTFKSVKEM